MQGKQESDDVNDKGVIVCKHCGASFESFRSLGGHASKWHKGMSAYYNRMIEVREARTSFRDALHLAKELVDRHGAADKQVKRSNFTTIRNVILQTRDRDLSKETPREQEASWFKALADELASGAHGNTSVYSQILDVKSSGAI